ncbi:CotH kinase family protein [Paenibacillus oenotherae]|uniref:CotH kinase family protein n=1 Tax=Paenibacillus oenotherae TaxID=1435645 RepID=A0ABS7D4E5_9BACL|nr:CotH kinase family protein [Paenibacillus oenotherae]MBW7474744.1 CotH kinase family protein [Paenibacillus oenotherae]
MKRSIKSWVGVCLAAAGMLAVAGCTGEVNDTTTTQPVSTVTSKEELAAAYSTKLVEDRSVYTEDGNEDIVTFYLTVSEHNLTADHPLSWSQFNSVRRVEDNTEDNKLDVLLQQGTEEGTKSGMFGFGDTHANGEITIRGKSTLKGDQKSYKIKLFDDTGLWRNQKTINLVKHAFDSTRLRNKLSFDYFKMIPDFTSLRTQFVHLYVKDLTAGSNAKYKDYGLYTQIEQPNKSFLRSHGLDPNGHLYKAVNFEFLRYGDALKKKDDPEYNKQAFDMILETKGSDNHEKLLTMLDEINNYTLPFDEVFDKHFDRDNFLTWMAVNIIMDNYDTINQNFLLYSPLNSNKWFFMPWDYDGGWGDRDFNEVSAVRRASWQRGIANYWGNVLQKRFFKNPDNVQQLTDKIEKLQTIITPEQTSKYIESYWPTVERYISRDPDLSFLPKDLNEIDDEIEQVKQLSVTAVEKFKKVLDNPMPFYLADIVQENGDTVFKWGESYDLEGEDLTYRFQLAKNPNFTNPIMDETLSGLTVTAEKLPAGMYYWKVVARDSNGNETPAFDEYTDTDNTPHFGVRRINVD